MIEVTIGDVRTGFIDNPVGADFITPGVEAATCFDYWYDGLKRHIQAEVLRDAANELEEMGVEPWNRLTPAIRTLRFRADRIEEGAR